MNTIMETKNIKTMTNVTEEIHIDQVDGTLTVSSIEIAERFGKQHKNLMQAIEGIISETSAEKSANLFICDTYLDRYGRKQKCYYMTRDGFSLLVMGFNGKAALQWKLKYIEAFNKMEAALREQNEKALPTTYKEALLQLLAQVELNEKLLEENETLAPKAEYHDEVLNKAGLITTGLIAKDLGMSAQALNSLMYLNHVIYKQGKSWKPFTKYEWLITDGYADYQSYTQDNANPQLKWTELGRKWIIEHIDEWKTVA